MIRPFIFACSAMLALVACEEGAQTVAPGGGPSAAVAAPPVAQSDAVLSARAAQLAANFRSIANENLGSGINIRDASSAGKRLRLEVEFPIAAFGISAADLNPVRSRVQRNQRRNVCSNDGLRDFLQQGGEIEMGLYGRDNGFIDDLLFDRPC